MWQLLSFIQKHLIWNIPLFMMLGITTGYNSDPAILKSLIIPLTFLMVFPMMVNLQIKKLFTHGSPKLQIVTQIINFTIIPFIAFGLGKLFFPEKPLIALGLLLAALLPTSGMTISWTGFAKGNMLAAIKMTVIGLVAGSILTPFYGKVLMGTTIEIPLIKVFKQIAIIVFLPMVLGFATRQLLLKKYGLEFYQEHLKQKFPLISTIGVLGIVYIAMALKAKSIIDNPSILLIMLIPLIILYALNFLISTLIGKLFFKRDDAIAMVYGTVMRNLSIALAIAMTAFGAKGSEIAIIISIAYIIQVQAAAWYVKFTNKIFGPVEN